MPYLEQNNQGHAILPSICGTIVGLDRSQDSHLCGGNISYTHMESASDRPGGDKLNSLGCHQQ